MTGAEQLANWVENKHSGQLIRKTSTPYLNHLMAVALSAKKALKLGYEIGLCHDLLEDTTTTKDELLQALLQFGYLPSEAIQITIAVVELTDVYIKSAYPNLRKSERKKLENKRLLTISALAQTVKYADLMDNMKWMLVYDLKHAKKYLKKKRNLIADLNRGNSNLRQEALDLASQSLTNILP